MSHTYFFPEPGTISGIPGTFAGVQVEVDEDKSEVIKVSPLARHPHFQPSQEANDQALEPEPEQVEHPEQEASAPEQAVETEASPPELPPEQPAQVEAPTDVAPPAEEAGSHTESEN